MARNESGLTDKQEAFIAAYVGEARMNATEAARLAGYAGDAQQWGEVGYQNMKKLHIRARIDAILQERALTSAEILDELKHVALAPVDRFMQVVKPEQRDPKTGMVTQEMIVRLDYGAKLKALELLGKARAMWTDKQEHSGRVEMAVTLDDLRAADASS